MGAFHDRIVLRKLSESARDYNHNQLVYGVQECYGSIMVQYGNVFILVNEILIGDHDCDKELLMAKVILIHKDKDIAILDH